MQKIPIILASRSPRRREILEMLGFTDFTIAPSAADEPEAEQSDPGSSVERIALHKLHTCPLYPRPDALIIASDTLVFIDGEHLGKPSDEADAKRMLRLLSGRTHSVYSGIALAYGGRETADFERTDVSFREITEDEINSYVSSGEPLDKAGAYAAQGLASRFIRRIDGDFWNVVGLPVCKFDLALKNLGVGI